MKLITKIKKWRLSKVNVFDVFTKETQNCDRDLQFVKVTKLIYDHLYELAITPTQVCEDFIDYVKNLPSRRIKKGDFRLPFLCDYAIFNLFLEIVDVLVNFDVNDRELIRKVLYAAYVNHSGIEERLFIRNAIPVCVWEDHTHDFYRRREYIFTHTASWSSDFFIPDNRAVLGETTNAHDWTPLTYADAPVSMREHRGIVMLPHDKPYVSAIDIAISNFDNDLARYLIMNGAVVYGFTLSNALIHAHIEWKFAFHFNESKVMYLRIVDIIDILSRALLNVLVYVYIEVPEAADIPQPLIPVRAPNSQITPVESWRRMSIVPKGVLHELSPEIYMHPPTLMKSCRSTIRYTLLKAGHLPEGINKLVYPTALKTYLSLHLE